jgi:hypothetical protein
VAWIESHQELAHHPKVARLANTLNVHKASALGHLHMFWWWCLSYAEDGDVTDFDAYELADGAQWSASTPEEFVAALQSSGWIDSSDGQLTVHDWWDYAGKLVERRRMDAERKRKARAEASPNRPVDVRADGVRTQPNPTVPNPTAPQAANFALFHSQRALGEVLRQKKAGLEVRSETGLAVTLERKPEFLAESERIWGHQGCKTCGGTGFETGYSPGTGGWKRECSV